MVRVGVGQENFAGTHPQGLGFAEDGLRVGPRIDDGGLAGFPADHQVTLDGVGSHQHVQADEVERSGIGGRFRGRPGPLRHGDQGRAMQIQNLGQLAKGVRTRNLLIIFQAANDVHGKARRPGQVGLGPVFSVAGFFQDVAQFVFQLSSHDLLSGCHYT